MIKKIILKNFRNFENSEFFFNEGKNIIIGENGKGKTNILYALSIFSNGSINKINFSDLVKKNKNNLYIKLETNKNIFAISYDKKENKKNYFINNKKVNKKKILDLIPKMVLFSPITMNIFYLAPSLRRDFLDSILNNTFTNYKTFLNTYKKILSSRNKILKNIKEGKSKIEELKFWNNEFVKYSSIIYNYRFGLINFIKENIQNFKIIFNGKIEKIDIVYKSKINNNFLPKEENLKDIQNQIKKFLMEKQELDIILGTTNIGPHVDDFEIIVDELSIINFASRGEVKSIIVLLKFLEIQFIENFTQKKPILLIDDLISELDNKHKSLLENKIKNYQSFITSIKNDFNNGNIIELQ